MHHMHKNITNNQPMPRLWACGYSAVSNDQDTGFAAVPLATSRDDSHMQMK